MDSQTRVHTYNKRINNEGNTYWENWNKHMKRFYNDGYELDLQRSLNTSQQHIFNQRHLNYDYMIDCMDMNEYIVEHYNE